MKNYTKEVMQEDCECMWCGWPLLKGEVAVISPDKVYCYCSVKCYKEANRMNDNRRYQEPSI